VEWLYSGNKAIPHGFVPRIKPTWLYSQNKAMWVGFIPSAVLVLSGAPLQEETQILFGTPCLYK